MALVFAGVTTIGRVRYLNPLTQNQGYLVIFPGRPQAFVRYEGVWEVLSLNSALGVYAQKQVIPLWVDATLIPGSSITNATHRFSAVWTRSGVNFELHTT